MLDQFEGLGRVREVAPLGRGLINDTFAVEADGGRFVLQRVNPIFAPEIHHNIEAVTARLREHQLAAPRLLRGPTGQPWHMQGEQVWRVMTRLPGVSFDAVTQPEQAHAAATILARFHGALAELDHTFVGLRVGVHDTPEHLAGLRDAVATHVEHRLFGEVATLAERILARAETLPALSSVRERVVHGDPKFNNVLFEGASGPASRRATALIDLDTVAPMPLHMELGDAWRSWCNPKGEDDARARFDMAVFEASLHGYAEAKRFALEPDEREAQLHGVEWITLELASRFAADALRERYFGWDRRRYPAAGEHNLVRAQGQWALHETVVGLRSERARLLGQVW